MLLAVGIPGAVSRRTVRVRIRHDMKNTAKIIAGVAFALALFVFAVFVESGLRGRYGSTMSIDGLPIKNVLVTGTWIPDFMWVGKAWEIEVKTEEDLELTLDGQVYFIPKGSHRIYSNHDSTNTEQFGSRKFSGYPKKVEVRTKAQANAER